VLFAVSSRSSQVESAVTTREQELRFVNQNAAEERTYLELIDDYEAINEEPHYHEIQDAAV